MRSTRLPRMIALLTKQGCTALDASKLLFCTLRSARTLIQELRQEGSIYISAYKKTSKNGWSAVYCYGIGVDAEKPIPVPTKKRVLKHRKRKIVLKHREQKRVLMQIEREKILEEREQKRVLKQIERERILKQREQEKLLKQKERETIEEKEFRLARERSKHWKIKRDPLTAAFYGDA